ncbi:MAG: hypothetical protein HW384_1223 [Dehalococcoidia bacterium]|nr:hypothetical protein [Dehalococcoidia bacterium]
MKQDNSLVPQEPQRPTNRSIEVTKIYLHKGESVTRSLWVKVNPRHPLLKLVLAPLAITAALAAFILVMLIVVIALLVFSIVWAVRRPGRGKTGRR